MTSNPSTTQADEAQAHAPDSAGAPSLKRKMQHGAAVSMGFFAISNAIRLASNLTLAYLLSKGDFGLMAMVGVVMQALQMFSDVGIAASLIQSKRGEDPRFLNTAWSIQVVRGVLLAIVACILAWPASAWFGQLEVKYLILAVSVTAIFDGFRSTKLITAERELKLLRCLTLSLIAQVLAVVVMLILAVIWRDAWSMVANGLVYTLVMTVLSHLCISGVRNRLHWDPTAATELFHFGRWVFLSTLFTFVAFQADKFFLGRYVTKEDLGVYQIAFGLSMMIQGVVESLTRQVVYPALSQVARDRPEDMRRVYYRVRCRLDAISLPGAGMLLMLGPTLVGLMYRDEYADVGWILQILILRTAMVSMLAPAENVLFSLGYPKYAFIRSLLRAIWLVVMMMLGWHFFKMPGVVWAVGLSEIPVLFVLWWGGHRHGVLNLLGEVRAVAMFLGGIAVGSGTLFLLSLI